ncbi:hypothetical protein [Duffyella gerundensis]|uniref:hypothetical protein n=1 Tax=Duffyella gerundensis TaxID=1619313 RepID=UPI0021F7239A|nr:hypothetical protein [Duffyella gerundensis]
MKNQCETAQNDVLSGALIHWQINTFTIKLLLSIVLVWQIQCYNSQQPTANSQQPTANSQQPTANSQQPTANSQQPTANSQQPTANSILKPQPTRYNSLHMPLSGAN